MSSVALKLIALEEEEEEEEEEEHCYDQWIKNVRNVALGNLSIYGIGIFFKIALVWYWNYIFRRALL
jgi:hypothetical protein